MRSMPLYARNGDVSLAYDVFGEGERDILVTFGWVGSFHISWDNPAAARMIGLESEGNETQARERIAEIVRYASSEDYFKIRREIGLAIG